MILVTGATGHFGRAAIDFLLKKGVKAGQILALVRNGKSAEDLKNKGVGVVIGDYDNYPSLVKAFAGVEKLLFVSGNDIAKRIAQHQNVVQAAKEAGVKHLVYTSFQRRTEGENSPLWIVAQSHIQTENWLKESGLDYTILRNNLYMDFLPGFIGEKVLETGVVYVPAGEGRVSAALRSDMAEAAAEVLVSDGHAGKAYDITNTEALSYQEIAEIISETSGRTVRYISPSVEDYGKTLAGFGVPSEVVGIFSGFALAQAKGELDVVSNDLEKLLGRKPVSVKEFLIGLYTPELELR